MTGAVRVAGLKRFTEERTTRGSAGAAGLVGVKGWSRVGRDNRGVEATTGVLVLGALTGALVGPEGVLVRAGRSQPDVEVFSGGFRLRSTGRLGGVTTGATGSGVVTVDADRSGRVRVSGIEGVSSLREGALTSVELPDAPEDVVGGLETVEVPDDDGRVGAVGLVRVGAGRSLTELLEDGAELGALDVAGEAVDRDGREEELELREGLELVSEDELLDEELSESEEEDGLE